MTTAVLLTVGEAARDLNVLEVQLREILRRDPALPTVKVGRTRAIDPSNLPRLRRALTAAGFLRTEEPAPCP